MGSRSIIFTLLVAVVMVVPCIAAEVSAGAVSNLTQTSCIGCHSNRLKTGGLSLEGSALDDPAIGEKVLKKVRAREMPPPPFPQLSPEVANAFASTLEAKLDQRAASAPRPGKPVLHRLNRAEYRNAIRDLFGLNIELGNGFPVDSSSFGFDNIGDVLSFNPLLLEQYLKIAKRISQLAVGDPDVQAEINDFKAAERQADWMGPGFPLGSRGGFSTKYYFPLDAEYGIQAVLRSDRLTLGPEPGKRMFAARPKLTAGYHTVTVTFPEEFAEPEGPFPNIPGMGGPPTGGPIDPLGSGPRHRIELFVDGERLRSWDIIPPDGMELSTPVGLLGGPPIVDKVRIEGPYNATGSVATPPMQAVFVCRPKAASDEDACATKIISNLASRAYRKPVDSQKLGVLIAVYKAERHEASFTKSIQSAIQAILTSPHFLFRIEEDPRGVAPGSPYPVNDYDLASRLSFFLWSTIPDQRLLDLAKEGRLNNPGTIQQEVRRMTADPRFSAFVNNFAGQWLSLRSVGQVKPDGFLFPYYDDGLVHDFKQETTLFFNRILREGRNVTELLSANYTYLNERLAAHYGIPGVKGPQFRLVQLDPAWHRGGILTQGSMLTTTAHPARTSPVLRGKWVLENILGAPPPPPPPGVNTDLPETPGRVQTMREQMEAHRANPTCAGCHSRMDPIGFALDYYDSTGAWRADDSGKAIDGSGSLTDGSSFSGPGDLRDILAAHAEQFVDTLTANLMTYALGRGLTADDQPLVRDIRRKAAANGYPFSSLILGVAESVPFRMAAVQPTDSKQVVAAAQKGTK